MRERLRGKDQILLQAFFELWISTRYVMIFAVQLGLFS